VSKHRAAKEPILGENWHVLIWVALAFAIPLLWFEFTDPRGLWRQYNHPTDPLLLRELAPKRD
jgi:hypothetical protein